MTDIKPVGQLKPLDTGVKPVGKLKPVQSNLTPIGQLKEGDPNTVLPKYKTPQDLAVNSAIDFIKAKGGRNGSTIMDSELDVLKDVLKDPRATEEQRKKAILTIQGYDDKHDDNNTMYYMKKEDNGVYVPTALAYGEKPPKGYKVASVWGNQNQSNDDNALTDISKSIFNGAIGAAEGVIDVAQIGKTLITGEESKYLNKLSNTAEALKFNKDEDLNKSIYDMSNIKTFSDLLDSKRFDVSPQALWGTLNGVVESFVGFYGGGKGASTVIKGVKGFSQGLKGVAKEVVEDGIVKNRILLSKPEQISSILAGSFAIQVGDVYDSAKEAGLEGRDAAGVATLIGGALASIDAASGLDGKIMSSIFNNEKKNTLKSVIKEVVKDLPKDKTGNITPEAMKELFARTTTSYAKIAKNGTKEVVKDILQEGGQEAAQDFTQKAGEQLWDKLSAEDKAKFGSNAFSAESFGSYLNSFASGLVGGAPMSLVNEMIKSKHDEQSLNAYERVKQGPEAVKALKADLGQALKNNDINQSEYEQAIFKIDSYDKYHQETKDVNLKPEDEKKAFELSFQIQGLKTEIPTNENEISKLEPINRAKVESKQKQVKELQSELNDIIRRGELKGEPVIPKKEEEKIAKEKEQEVTDKQEERKKKKEKIEINSKLSQKENPDFPIEPKLEKQPEFTQDKRTYDEIAPEEFNHSKMNARTVHRVLRKKLSEMPNNEMNGQLFLHQYEYNGKKNRTIRVKLEDGRIIKLASTKIIDQSGLSGHLHTERFKGNITNEPVGVKVIELKPTEEGKLGKKVIKVYQKSDGKFLSWVKETNTGKGEALDKEGKALYTPEQLDELEELKLQDEPPTPPEELERLRNTPITPILPKSVKEKAEEATNKIVEEAKKKVAESKPTVKDKFKKAVDLYYKATEAEGATQRRNKANERKKFLEENPDIKYIDDNIKEIFSQLSEKNLITKEGNCP